ncbi:hypothetical protein AB6A40_005196 [Gnathostoma spinigerum]|uniref:Uncharacterized protein n=1 Tax=Gnathostoma spinigerum TaxID=75299 RepID=A0ABD6EPK3_9BILA
MLALSVLFIVITNANIVIGQEQQQCLCSEIQPCLDKSPNVGMPCADECQEHFGSAGVNYGLFRKCIAARSPEFTATVQCLRDSFPDACSNTDERVMVQQSDPIELELAIANSIETRLGNSGVLEDVQGIMEHGKRFLKCFRACIQHETFKCARDNNCGLALPDTNTLVNTGIDCALKGGFNNEVIQSLCSCMVSSGLDSLASVCPRLNLY